MFSGSLTIEFRGALAEVLYRRTSDGDVDWQFAMDKLNDTPLKPQERRDIRREILGEGK